MLSAIGVSLLLVGCAPKSPEPATPAEVAQRAETYLQAQANAGFFSGAALIIREGTLLYQGAFGFADESRALPNTTQTRFPIASISKTFTAAAVLQLVEEEQLNLDTPVNTVLASLPSGWSTVTVHHLLTHTSGIPNYTERSEFAEQHPAARTPEQVLDLIRGLPLEFEPGEQYRYSNSNYLLLAQLVEDVTGQSFATALKNQLIDPLELKNTAEGGSISASDHATGYVPDGLEMTPASRIDPSWVLGAGSMVSTVDDLHRWVEALAAGKVLTAATLQKSWQADKGPYGYGWQVLDSWPPEFGRPLILHAGGLHGFASDLLYYPRDGVVIVILANLETSPMARIARDLSAIVFGADYSLPMVRKPVTVDPSILHSYVGDYEIAPSVTLTVRRQDGQLVVQATGQPEDIVIPESEHKFFSRRVDAQITFVQDAAGTTTHLIIQQNGAETRAVRQPL